MNIYKSDRTLLHFLCTISFSLKYSNITMIYIIYIEYVYYNFCKKFTDYLHIKL